MSDSYGAPPPPRRPTAPPSAAEQQHAQLIAAMTDSANAFRALAESIDRNTAVTHTLLQAMLLAGEDDQQAEPAGDGEEPPAFEVASRVGPVVPQAASRGY